VKDLQISPSILMCIAMSVPIVSIVVGAHELGVRSGWASRGNGLICVTVDAVWGALD
jgi:hypothetical protein